MADKMWHELMHDNIIIPEFETSYKQLIEIGTNSGKEKNVAIVAIARNVEERLPYTLGVFDEIEKLFNKTYFYLYENDSTDSTVEIIQKWADRKNNVVFEHENVNAPHLPQSTSTLRTENLARARNKCQDYVQSIKDQIDYVIVIDIDFIAFSINGIKNSLGWLQTQSHVSAISGFSFLKKQPIFPNGTLHKNEILTNYDCWAWRHTWWSDTHQVGMMYWFQWWIPLVGSPLIQTNSSFGGSCIYRKDYYLSGKYSGENCEHVMFHQSITQDAKDFSLFCNPSQIMYVEL